MASLKTTATAIVGVTIALATGLIGLWCVFTDLGPSESMAGRISILVLAYLVGAGLVGVLLPRRWYVASVAAWGPVLLGSAGLVAKVSRGGAMPRWSFLIAALLIIPAVCLMFGFGGSWLRRRLSNGTGADRKSVV